MKPKLIIKEDSTPFVTDGEIDESEFIVKKQTSRETVQFLHEFFIKHAKNILYIKSTKGFKQLNDNMGEYVSKGGEIRE